METIYLVLGALQSFSIGLGVGCSTLAIINFFVAIADGEIDPSERRMMGVVYVLLRIAMTVILFTSLLLFFLYPGSDFVLHDMPMMLFGLITILYCNAILMTLRIMPSTFGPAIQASAWYSLGLFSALGSLGYIFSTPTKGIILYIVVLLCALVLVNGVMFIQKCRRRRTNN